MPTKEEKLKKIREIYGENTPQSKADIKPEIPEENMNVTPMGSLQAGGANIGGGLGENIIYPYIFKKIYKAKYNKDLSDEEAKSLAQNYYEKAQTENPGSYGLGVAAREIGTGEGLGLISGALKSVPGIRYLAKNFIPGSKKAENLSQALTYGGYGGLSSAAQGGDTTDIAESSLIGAAVPSVLRKTGNVISEKTKNIPDFLRGTTRILTGTNPQLGQFIKENPIISKEVAKQGAPTSEELITNAIERTKPTFENMKFFIDAQQYRNEAVNHLLDAGYSYSPQKIINKINEKIKDLPIATKETESLRKTLQGEIKFYENEFKDTHGNIVDLTPQAVDRAIYDFQQKAKNAYKKGASKKVEEIYRNLAAQIRDDVGKDVPGYDKYMKLSENSVNKGLFLKKKLGQVPEGYNWTSAAEEEIGKIPISPSKLESTIFNRPNTKIGLGMERDATLRRMNEILPPGAQITPEDILRVQGRKLIENPKQPGTGSAPVLTGALASLPIYHTAKSFGMSPEIASTFATGGGLVVGNILRTRGPEMAGKGYRAIGAGEEFVKNNAQAIQNLMDRTINTKYQRILQDAASNGSKSFAATVFALKSSDDEFRKIYNEANGIKE